MAALDETRRLLARAEALVAGGAASETYELLGAQATEDLAHGRLERAIERLSRAMELPGVRLDPLRLAETYGTLVICMAYAHHPDTVAVAERMMVEAAGSDSAVATAWCWYASGECRLDLDPGRARAHLERAVAARRAGGSTFVEGIAGASLASLEVRGGDLAEATAHYRWLIPLGGAPVCSRRSGPGCARWPSCWPVPGSRSWRSGARRGDGAGLGPRRVR